MPFVKCAGWSHVVRGFFAATLLATIPIDRAAAEIIPREDTFRGVRMTRQECEAKPQTLWLNVYDRNFCVRYYLSSAGGEGTRPVIGERDGAVHDPAGDGHR